MKLKLKKFKPPEGDMDFLCMYFKKIRGGQYGGKGIHAKEFLERALPIIQENHKEALIVIRADYKEDHPDISKILDEVGEALKKLM